MLRSGHSKTCKLWSLIFSLVGRLALVVSLQNIDPTDRLLSAEIQKQFMCLAVFFHLVVSGSKANKVKRFAIFKSVNEFMSWLKIQAYFISAI